MNRRNIIKKILTTGSGFGILSLLPQEARANGSWGFQGLNDRPIPQPQLYPPEQPRYFVPFSNEWRLERMNQKQIQRNQGNSNGN